MAADVPVADEKAREAARAALVGEIESSKRSRKSPRLDRPHKKLLAAVIALVLGSGALAAANELRQSAFRSDTAPVVYSLEPLDPEFAERVLRGIERLPNRTATTTGDVLLCERRERQGEVDPACQLLLQANRDGNVDPVPGPPTLPRLQP